MGYRVYNSTFSLGSSYWTRGISIKEGSSDWMEFYWWTVEGAKILACGLTLFTVLLL